jgi:hypothetical protein
MDTIYSSVGFYDTPSVTVVATVFYSTSMV